MDRDVLEIERESLESLMERYATGSAEAFNELYRRVAPKLFGYLLRVTRDRTLAEDVLQTTFAKVHRARSAYLHGSPLVPWVLVIARRTFYDEMRASAARWEVLSEDGTLPDRDMAEETYQLERSADVERALAELPPHYRDAIELTKLSGFSGQEAAQALNTTASAIKLRVHRGYRLLRGLLESGADVRAGAANMAGAIAG